MTMPDVQDWWSDPATRKQTLQELRKLSRESQDPYNTVEGYTIMLWLNLPGNQALTPHMDALLRAGLSPRYLLAAIPKQRGRPRTEPPAKKRPTAASMDEGLAAIDMLVRKMRANGLAKSDREALRKLCDGVDKASNKHSRPNSRVLGLQQKLSRWRKAQRVAKTK
jgi:hypothetical protein